MKRLILFELIILFLATTFESDSPPGWFQQVLPVNKTVRDIFFLDSSTGWVVTTGGSSSTDTAYILNTTNGGSNWLRQKEKEELRLFTQMVSSRHHKDLQMQRKLSRGSQYRCS